MQKVIGEILLNYEVVGRGEKNLLILPGWLASLKQWLPVAEALKDKYRVILLDFPGFGESSKPKEDWGVYEYAEFTEKFLKELGVIKTIVLGHSFGGRVAILLASKTNLVENLILVDSAGMEIKTLSVIVKTKLAKIFKPARRFLPKTVKDFFHPEDYKQSAAMAGIFKKVISQPLRDELKDIKVPTLIIWGERDSVLSLAEAKMIKSGIRDSTLRVVWGVGHWPHLEKPKEFLGIMYEENI